MENLKCIMDLSCARLLVLLSLNFEQKRITINVYVVRLNVCNYEVIKLVVFCAHNEIMKL